MVKKLDTETRTIRLPKQTWKKLRIRADKNGRNLSQELLICLNTVIGDI